MTDTRDRIPRERTAAMLRSLDEFQSERKQKEWGADGLLDASQDVARAKS